VLAALWAAEDINRLKVPAFFCKTNLDFTKARVSDWQ